jgi:vacuolar protein-sorting-associated protein 4
MIIDMIRNNAKEENALEASGNIDAAIRKSEECIKYLELLSQVDYSYAAQSNQSILLWKKKITSLKQKYDQGSDTSSMAGFKNVSDSSLTSKMRKEFRDEILGTIYSSPARIPWESIGGMEAEKKLIKKIEFFAMARPQGNVPLLSTQKNILMYGPPGTGKTLLARAIASNIKATFFNADVSKLISRYVGDSSRLISTLFEVAREKAPSIIFLDDLESLVLNRQKFSSANESGVLSTILTSMDGLTKTKENLIVIGATNQPYILDEAVLSRFPYKLYIPLPDAAARQKILEVNIKGKGLKFEGNYWEIAKEIDGYSGREITQACEDAIMSMLERANPNAHNSIDKVNDISEIHRMVYKVDTVMVSDLKNAFKNIRKSVTRDMIQKYEKWKSDYVVGG